MRILLLGSGGQVGSALKAQLDLRKDVTVVAPARRPTDGGATIDFALNPDFAYWLDFARPNAVVNAAAYTAVDRAESEPALADLINGIAPANLALACARSGVPLVHYSTDYVFDGQADGPYSPGDAPNPINAYGRSKLLGERGIAESGAIHLILRTSWVYGLTGRNFLRSMLRADAPSRLHVVDDQFGGPTPAWLVAQTTLQILDRGIDATGVHHVAAAGNVSWRDFARAIFEESFARGLISRKPEVVGIPSSDYPAPARRPAHSVLDTASLRETYGIELPDWRDALSKTFDLA